LALEAAAKETSMATLQTAALVRRTWRHLFPPLDWLDAPRSYAEDLIELRSIAHEGLAREDDLYRLLLAVRDDERLSDLAPEAGELVSRYLGMRRELAHIDAFALQPYACALSEVFDYYAQLLYYAVDLLAESWRSGRLREQQLQVGPLGPQSERLESIVSELDLLACELEEH
jgi:hypothetical protein